MVTTLNRVNSILCAAPNQLIRPSPRANCKTAYFFYFLFKKMLLQNLDIPSSLVIVTELTDPCIVEEGKIG
jgi:hypothetical protein